MLAINRTVFSTLDILLRFIY